MVEHFVTLSLAIASAVQFSNSVCDPDTNLISGQMLLGLHNCIAVQCLYRGGGEGEGGGDTQLINTL